MAVRKPAPPLDWEDLRYFVALARHGSLSAAARALRVNHATVARRVKSLESRLGRALFEQRPDGYLLTGDGKAILEEAGLMEEAALSLLRRLDAGIGLAGTVRISISRILADGFLAARLGGLRKLHPQLDIELLTESRIVSLARREADIALRIGRIADSELVGSRVAQIGYGFYAAPGWRKSDAPVFVGFDEDSDFVPDAAWLRERFPDSRLAFRSNSQTAQAAAAAAGFGVAILPRYLAAQMPDLAPVRLGEQPPDRDLWLLTRRDLARAPRVRAVMDHLREIFRRHRKILAGR